MSTKYINLNNFDKIIKYANLLCPNKKNSKYTNEYYLTNIISILTDFVKWSSLKISKHIISNKKYHYKTIQKIHTLWSKKNIYGLVFNEIISNDNKYKITNNVYIDATLIINKTGIENIGYGCGESKKKKFTSLTAICNENMHCLTIFVNDTNEKEIIRNNKINKIKTLSHDSKGILPAIDNLNKLDNTKKYNLVGDAGYIVNSQIIQNNNITIVTYKRKNQLIKNTENEINILKKRYKIENFFAKIKAYNRIHIRRDKLISSYLGFVFLASIFIL